MLRSIHPKKKSLKKCCVYNLHNLEDKIYLRWDSLENTMQLLLSGQTENAFNTLHELQENEERKQENFPFSFISDVIDLFAPYPLQSCITLEGVFSLNHARKVLNDKHMTDVDKYLLSARTFVFFETLVLAKTASDYLGFSYFSTKNEKGYPDCHSEKKTKLKNEKTYVKKNVDIKEYYSDCRVSIDVVRSFKRRYVLDVNPHTGWHYGVLDVPHVAHFTPDMTDVFKNDCDKLEIANFIRPNSSLNKQELRDLRLYMSEVADYYCCFSNIEEELKPLSCEPNMSFYHGCMNMNQTSISSLVLPSHCYLN